MDIQDEELFQGPSGWNSCHDLQSKKIMRVSLEDGIGDKANPNPKAILDAKKAVEMDIEAKAAQLLAGVKKRKNREEEDENVNPVKKSFAFNFASGDHGMNSSTLDKSRKVLSTSNQPNVLTNIMMSNATSGGSTSSVSAAKAMDVNDEGMQEVLKEEFFDAEEDFFEEDDDLDALCATVVGPESQYFK